MDVALRRLAILGFGKMGSTLLQAFLKQSVVQREQVSVTVAHAERAAGITRDFSVHAGTDNAGAAANADVVLICVKPQVVAEVLQQIRSVVGKDTLVISIAASVNCRYMEQRLESGTPVVRAMPNTPAQVGCGMTALSKGSSATTEHLKVAERLFRSVGLAVIVDEKHMDAITGLSASGPAFVYVILESLAEAGVKLGLPREMATLLVAQTTLGAAKMVLDTGHHPALLKDAVTTPAGCTIDGLLELEEGKVRVTLIKAVVRAAERAGQLLLS